MENKKYKMKLVLGDWSGDGHNQSDEYVLETNKPVKDIQDAYKASCKLTGLSFNHGDDFTGKQYSYEEQEKYHICTEYESSEPSPEAVEILTKFGIECPEEFAVNFTQVWIAFVKLSLPDLEAVVLNDDIPYINGYWDKNLNVGFGYGLYY